MFRALRLTGATSESFAWAVPLKSSMVAERFLLLPLDNALERRVDTVFLTASLCVSRSSSDVNGLSDRTELFVLKMGETVVVGAAEEREGAARLLVLRIARAMGYSAAAPEG